MAASVAVLFLAMGQAEASAVACFAPADAKAAQLRRMQQEFTVAALSCGSVQAQRDSLIAHYNEFVVKFATVLRDNARVLLAHFSRHGGSNGFDSWMTRLANSAAEDAATDPTFCQHLWSDLDATLAVAPADITEFAAAIRSENALTPVCGRHRQAVADTTVGLKD